MVISIIKTVDLVIRQSAPPNRPFPVDNPALAESGDPNTVDALQTVREIEDLNLDRVVISCYAGQQVLVLTDQRRCCVVLYTLRNGGKVGRGDSVSLSAAYDNLGCDMVAIVG